MAIVALTRESTRLGVGDEWLVTIQVVSDTTGLPVADATTTATVTDPAGTSTTPEVATPVGGTYQLAPTVDTVGRWVAAITIAGYGTARFSAEVAAVVADDGMPTADDVIAYLGAAGESWSQDVITAALAAERAAQAANCSVPAVYPADLREALLRRVAANLARRQIGSLTGPQGDAEFTPSPPVYDPEVRRLEAPYRPVLMR